MRSERPLRAARAEDRLRGDAAAVRRDLLRHGDRLRARQPGDDRPRSRRARAGTRAARRGGRALRAGRRRARAGRRARAPCVSRARRRVARHRRASVSSARCGCVEACAIGVVSGWRCWRSGSWRPSSGDYSRAEQPLSEARELFRRAGDRWGLVSALWRTADLAIARGRLDDADAALQEARAVVGETERQGWIAVTVATLAEVAQLRGDAGRAADAVRAGSRALPRGRLGGRRRGDGGASAKPRQGSAKTAQSARRVGLPVQRQPNGGSHECNNRPGPRGCDGAGAAARRSTGASCAPTTRATPRRAGSGTAPSTSGARR